METWPSRLPLRLMIAVVLYLGCWRAPHCVSIWRLRSTWLPYSLSRVSTGRGKDCFCSRRRGGVGFPKLDGKFYSSGPEGPKVCCYSHVRELRRCPIGRIGAKESLWWRVVSVQFPLPVLYRWARTDSVVFPQPIAVGKAQLNPQYVEFYYQYHLYYQSLLRVIHCGLVSVIFRCP